MESTRTRSSAPLRRSHRAGRSVIFVSQHKETFVMRRILLVSLAALPLVGCQGMSVGVGVGGTSGNVGVGGAVSADVGGNGQSGSPSQLTVSMFKIDANGVGAEIGTLSFRDTRKGLHIQAALHGLTPGDHGMHIHEKGDCGAGMKDGKPAAGVAAGGHFDPNATGKHMGPDGDGHRGDLPVLHVDQKGDATGELWVLRLGTSDVRGHAIVIHEGGDNYSDQPKPLGGGGARIACGVVSAQ
jgi:Cu-Zn family superoxide dismutase